MSRMYLLHFKKLFEFTDISPRLSLDERWEMPSARRHHTSRRNLVEILDRHGVPRYPYGSILLFTSGGERVPNDHRSLWSLVALKCGILWTNSHTEFELHSLRITVYIWISSNIVIPIFNLMPAQRNNNNYTFLATPYFLVVTVDPKTIYIINPKQLIYMYMYNDRKMNTEN